MSAARYQLGDELAGSIMRATDRRLRREVAVKVLAGDDAERFEREAKLIAGLQHPGIVPVHDAGRTAEGRPFYSMKLVAGRTLREAMVAGADPGELLPHVQAAADAVAYAHSRGVVHGDLEPANVLVGAFGETLVIDWGQA
ncbi:MAG TPA: protein kinase, partial [Kofleriaceae bacterium]|nr:protein kinase [Kofleriaceae bacterium]